MSNSTDEFCRRAFAYLKIDIEHTEEDSLRLPEVDSPVLRTLGNRLLLAYVVDDGESFTYVQNRHLQEAGMTSDELHEIAIRNLSVFAGERAEVKQHGNVFATLMGGNFEASLIVVDEFWSKWYAHVVHNGFVIAIPARDILAFGDASSPAAVAELRELCQRCEGKVDHPLTKVLYRRTGGSWEPLNG